jgi:alkylated DNA nucleotide flippase Atl1
VSEEYVEAVLAVVESIPAGRVMSYGDIAEFLAAGGPRQVGSALSREGGAVPWWRVVHADGSAPPGKDGRARREWIAERTPLRPSGRIDMARARWVPDCDGRGLDAPAETVGGP